jgi:TatD DNase family protein
MPPFVDSHCHVFQYRDPEAILAPLEACDTIVVAMTEAPSVYERLRHRARAHARVRLALGVHPLLVHRFPALEWELFRRYLETTSYIGEVGLDFSRAGRATRAVQETAFRKVLAAVGGRAKLLSLHSRGAETAVLEHLQQAAVGPCIWHWYSGSLATLDALLADGHAVSINPAMLQSSRGKQVIARVPPQQALVETDGPYARIDGQPAVPSDVRYVYDYLAALWQEPLEAVTERVYGTFRALLGRGDADREN